MHLRRFLHAIIVGLLVCSIAHADIHPPGWVDYTGASSVSVWGNSQQAVTLPFNFDFYGSSTSQATLQSNGYLGLTSSLQNYDSAPSWPDDSWGSEVVAAMWHDFNPASSSNLIYHQTVGSTGNRRFAATWDTWADSEGTQRNIFQIQLHEADGDISYHYYALDGPEDGSRVGINRGDGSDYTGFWYDGGANYDGSGIHNANQDGPDGSLEGWRITYTYDADSESYHADAEHVPEPGTMALMLVGIAGVITARRQRSV